MTNTQILKDFREKFISLNPLDINASNLKTTILALESHVSTLVDQVQYEAENKGIRMIIQLCGCKKCLAFREGMK